MAITLDEMKKYLRVDYTDDDSLISWSMDMPNAVEGGSRADLISLRLRKRLSGNWKKRSQGSWEGKNGEDTLDTERSGHSLCL